MSFRPRFTMLDRYLLGGLLRPSLICFGLTLMMMMLERAIRLIDQIVASGGEVRFFFPLMAAELPYYIGLALPAAFFISMFMVVIRMDDGSEIEAMMGSGRSLARITAPLVVVGAVLGVVSLIVLGFVEPWGHYEFRRIQNTATQAGWSGRLQSGAFVTPDTTSTLTADFANAAGRAVRGVFISRIDPDGGESMVTAGSGVLSDGPEDKTVRLALGRGRAMAERSGGHLQVGGFENIVLSSPRGATHGLNPRGETARELTLPELIEAHVSPRSGLPPGAVDAEIYSRLGLSFSLVLLPLLALPLGVVSKRGRRAPGLVVAALLLVIFHHGVQLISSLASLGKLDPLVGVGGLFIAFATFTLWLFLGSLKRPGETPLSGVLERVAVMVEGVGERIYRLWRSLKPGQLGPTGRTVSLQGYVARRLIIRTGAAAAVIVTLLQMFELIGRAGDILGRGVGLSGLAYYMLLLGPGMLQQSVGFAMFAGLVLTFMELASNGEMIAMRAAGVSLRQLMAMLMPVALMVGAIDLVVADVVAPRTERTMQAWLQETALPGSKPPPPRWFRTDGEIVRAETASRQGDSIRGVRIYRRDANSAISQRILAASAVKAPQGWVLTNAEILTVQQEQAVRSTSPRLAWATSLRPSEVVELFQPTLQVSALEAFRSLHGGAADRSIGFMLTRLYRLFAEPLAPVVMLLLAAPLAVVHGRNARGLGSVLYGVGGGMAYLVTDGLFTASGQTGALPATAAAWTAPLIFAIAAFTVLLYVEL
jgi:lipopolysaccharide export system permease protein